jgi:hypothetical protein
MRRRPQRQGRRLLRSPIVEHQGGLFLIANWACDELHTGSTLVLVPLSPDEAKRVRDFHEVADRELYARLRPRVARRVGLDELEQTVLRQAPKLGRGRR